MRSRGVKGDAERIEHDMKELSANIHRSKLWKEAMKVAFLVFLVFLGKRNGSEVNARETWFPLVVSDIWHIV